MGVNFIMRGQEFLSQTWRQKLLRQALGFDEPRYAHLPLIMDMAGRKLSKRDGDVEVFAFRKAGYLPEVLGNFIALLGWSPGGDREKMTLAEMVELFTPDRLSKTNAKFDRTKLLAFNTDAVAAASEQRLVDGFADYLSVQDQGGTGGSPASLIPANDCEMLGRMIRANHGFRTFADLVAKCSVLFGPDDAYAFDEKAVAKVLEKNGGAGYAVLAELRALLDKADWTEPALKVLVENYCQRKSLSMGQVAQPIRVAVTGTTISPAIYDTLLFLGKAKTLARIDRCLRQKA
jgi:glutamyl-tRNA synthetase